MMRTLLLLATVMLTGSLAAAQVTFSSTYYPTSGSQGMAEASGDFNRDGRPDMAVGTDNAVDIFFNVGGGKFGNRTTYGLANNGSQLRAADLNNDGWLDLAAAEAGTLTLVTLLNNGNGTFRPGPTTTLAMPESSFVAGDLNRDGNIDLVVKECDFSIQKCQFQVLRGTGTGTFTGGQILALANSNVSGPILADLTRDGKLDLVNTRDPKVFVWKGNGDGTFAAPTSYQPPAVCTDDNVCGDSLVGLALGDFNNDTALDVAVLQAHFCGSSCGENTAYLYKNTGAGGLALASSVRIPIDAGGSLYVTDLNGDQNMDLLAVNGGHFSCGSTYAPGRGDFTFGTQGGLPSSGCESSDLVARDFNLDSRHDLAISFWMDGSWQAAINTNAYTNCAPPSSANIAARICGPANGATVASPVLIKGSGNSPLGVQRLEIWVDGVKKYEKWNDQVAKRIALSAGSHRITVVAVDQYKGTGKTSVTVNVQ